MEKDPPVDRRVSHVSWTQKGFGLIIIVVVVPVPPMTMVVPISVTVRSIIVIVSAIVMGIVAPVVYRIRLVITGPDRYTKVTISLRFLRRESDKTKR